MCQLDDKFTELYIQSVDSKRWSKVFLKAQREKKAVENAV